MRTIGAFAAGAACMLEGGYSPCPKRYRSHVPAIRGWDRLRTKPLSLAEIKALIAKDPTLGLAVMGGFNGLLPVDVDTDDKTIIAVVSSALPRPNVVRIGQRGFAAFYRDRTGSIGSRKFQTPKPTQKMLVELLPNGNVTIPPTIHHALGQPYRWVTPNTLFNTPVEELVEITPEHIKRLEAALELWVPSRPVYAPLPTRRQPPVSGHRMGRYAQVALDRQVTNLGSLPYGRNPDLFSSICVIGKFVHHGYLDAGEVEAKLISACQDNGYLRRAGMRQVQATIRSGLDQAKRDKLPVLTDRPKPRTA